MNDKNQSAVGIDRRAFMKAGGALLFAAQCPATFATQTARGETAMLNSFVKIAPDNSITLIANHSEFGNGAYTVMSMMLAEELDVDYQSIQLEDAPTRPEYYSTLFGEYLTAGSVTTGSTWLPLRTAGAKARAMLIAAAAALWTVDTTTLTTRDGKVHHEASGKSASYGDLLVVITAQ